MRDSVDTAFAVVMFFLLVIPLLVWLYVSARPVAGAPAPVWKPGPPIAQRIVGQWRMRWGSLPGVALVGRDGAWANEVSGTHYVGSWSLEGNVLTLRERQIEGSETQKDCVYRITLDEPGRTGGVAGRFESGMTFSLRE